MEAGKSTIDVVYKILYIVATKKASKQPALKAKAPAKPAAGGIEKPIKWMGSSYEDLVDFPEEILKKAGFQLHLVQHGLEPDDWAPMTIVGPGSNEIRLRDKDGWYRIIYVAKFDNAVYVLHSFQKKTNETSKGDIAVATERYKLAKKDHEESGK